MAILERIDAVGGSAEESTNRYLLRNPSNLEQIGELHCETPQAVAAAVVRARQAQQNWEAIGLKERIHFLKRLRKTIFENRERIVETVIRETGKPRQDAFAMEVYSACDHITYWCKNAKKTLVEETLPAPGILRFMKKLTVTYKPLGVVGLIKPWNGPFAMAAWYAVQAMLAGNSVVIKGSEVTPFSYKIFEEMCQLAGLPDGVCQVLMGDGATGAALLEQPLDKLCFTGSVATGRKIARSCAERLIPYSLELGGKDAMIVCDDANLDDAAHGAVWGGCINTGHFCCGVERIYVEEGVYDAFLAKVIEQAKAVRIGQKHGYDEDMGAVFWDRQMAIIQAQVEDARERGATIHCGGEKCAELPGLYYKPTVMTGVEEDWDIMSKETFGPVLPIVKVKNVEEAVTRANDSEYGLHGSVWTQDINKGFRIARQIETGSMSINEIHLMAGMMPVPFAGVKESGVGGINGMYSLRSFCHAQPILSGKYTGQQSGFPYERKKYEQMEKFLGFVINNPIGRFFFD